MSGTVKEVQQEEEEEERTTTTTMTRDGTSERKPDDFDERLKARCESSSDSVSPSKSSSSGLDCSTNGDDAESAALKHNRSSKRRHHDKFTM